MKFMCGHDVSSFWEEVIATGLESWDFVSKNPCSDCALRDYKLMKMIKEGICPGCGSKSTYINGNFVECDACHWVISFHEFKLWRKK